MLSTFRAERLDTNRTTAPVIQVKGANDLLAQLVDESSPGVRGGDADASEMRAGRALTYQPTK